MMTRWSFTLIFCVLSFLSYSQDRPRVALVLSGGGAKGIAHIPLLQAMDSLGFKPDMVIGNSMGSVIGGLYAMGYSGDELEKIAKEIEWDQILTNKIPFNYVNPFEKDEYDKYFVELPFTEWDVEVPLGIIEGQELSLLLTRLARRVGYTNDFDKFPIPFRCIATDLINGKVVVFKDGDVARAMRASVAIPSIFTPVEYDDKLLVDGGVLNNFPVDIAIEMGADIVIGSDVSGGLSDRPESMMKLLFESSMISAKTRNDEQRAKCDLLFGHVENIKFESSDFDNTPEIIENGRVEVRQKMADLVKLVKGLEQRNLNNGFTSKDTFSIREVRFKDINSNNKKLLEGRTEFDSSNVSIRELEEFIRISFGSRLFEKLSYSLDPLDTSYRLKVLAKERKKTYLKGAVHFDTERGAGVVLNLTKRDLLGKNSRQLITLDLAENPKIRLQHQSYLNDPRWWYRIEGFRERVDQNTYVNGSRSGNFRFDYGKIRMQLNRDISNYTTLSGGLIYNRDSYRPGIRPEAKNISPDSLTDEINSYQFIDIGLRVGIYQNKLTSRFFPKDGQEWKVSLSYYPYSFSNLDWYSNQREDVQQQINHIFQLEAWWTKNIPLSPKFTLRGDLHFGSFLVNDNSFYELGTIRYFVLGGIDPRANRQYVNFAGLREGELPASQLGLASARLQWEFINNFFCTPSVNVAVAGVSDFNSFFSNAGDFRTDWQRELSSAWLYSFDINLGVNTPAGPLQLQASKINRVDRVRFYLSFGFYLF